MPISDLCVLSNCPCALNSHMLLTFLSRLCLQYPDGQSYLATYSFEHYQKQDFWWIAGSFLLCNVVVFYLGLNSVRDNLYYFLCCGKSRYLVTDKYGFDSREYGEKGGKVMFASMAEVAQRTVGAEVSSAVSGTTEDDSTIEHGQHEDVVYHSDSRDAGDESQDDDGFEYDSDGAGDGFGGAGVETNGHGHARRARKLNRNRLYSGLEEEIFPTGPSSPRASSDLNKEDLSFIRTNSALAPKIFARETSVSSQTGFKTTSSYSRGFSSAGSGTGGVMSCHVM